MNLVLGLIVYPIKLRISLTDGGIKVAEFKIDKALTSEIAGLRDSGNLINDGYTSIPSDDVSTLKTSVGIISQHASIKSLLDLYKSLVLRDAQDLDELVEEVSKMDASISSSYNI